jgi:hypothetical protein
MATHLRKALPAVYGCYVRVIDVTEFRNARPGTEQRTGADFEHLVSAS